MSILMIVNPASAEGRIIRPRGNQHMPRVTVETSHALSEEEAVQRLKDKLSALKETYQGQFSDLCEEWNGNTFSYSFRAAGMKFAGTVTVQDSLVKLAAVLPLATIMFRGVIKAQVDKQLGELLA